MSTGMQTSDVAGIFDQPTLTQRTSQPTDPNTENFPTDPNTENFPNTQKNTTIITVLYVFH